MIGKGHIFLPFDVNREEFIEHCFRKRRVSILTEGAGAIHNCIISFEALKQIYFPLNQSEEGKSNRNLGSQVSYIVDEIKRIPIIIAVIPKEGELFDFREAEGGFVRTFKGATVSIKGSAKKKSLIVSVDAEEGAEVNIICSGTDSILNIESSSEVNVKADKINVESDSNLSLKCITESGETSLILTEEEFSLETSGGDKINSDGGDINIVPKNKANFFTGGSPAVLGDKNKETLEAIQSTLNNLNSAMTTFSSAVSTAAVEPLLAPAAIALTTSLGIITTQISNIVSKINETNSKKQFTD